MRMDSRLIIAICAGPLLGTMASVVARKLSGRFQRKCGAYETAAGLATGRVAIYCAVLVLLLIAGGLLYTVSAKASALVWIYLLCWIVGAAIGLVVLTATASSAAANLERSKSLQYPLMTYRIPIVIASCLIVLLPAIYLTLVTFDKTMVQTLLLAATLVGAPATLAAVALKAYLRYAAIGYALAGVATHVYLYGLTPYLAPAITMLGFIATAERIFTLQPNRNAWTSALLPTVYFSWMPVVIGLA